MAQAKTFKSINLTKAQYVLKDKRFLIYDVVNMELKLGVILELIKDL